MQMRKRLLIKFLYFKGKYTYFFENLKKIVEKSYQFFHRIYVNYQYKRDNAF